MDFIGSAHSRFVRDTIHAAKIYPSIYSAIPTVVFLLCSALMLYSYFHRYTSVYSKWSTRFGRDVLFQWVFFYVTRAWFLFMRILKLLDEYMDTYIERYIPEQHREINRITSQACMILLVTTVSLIPLLIAVLKLFYRTEVPNFLIWVGEDPWLRSEIGISGHLLERPNAPRISQYKCNTRFRRSCSEDSELSDRLITFPYIIRNCKSLTTLGLVKSRNFN